MARKTKKKLEAALMASIKGDSFDVGAYVRLSAADRKQKGDSIETQQAIINSYILDKDELVLRDIYIDNGLSGQSFERPAFKRMLEDMASGRINCCITKDLSRLGRNAIETTYYIEKYFPANNIRFISITDDYDSSDKKSNEMTITLKNTVNEIYALEVGHKTRASKQLSIQAGHFIGRLPPYGYKKDNDNKYKLVPDENTAPIVRRMFEMALAGMGVKAIRQWLNSEQIPPPKRYFHSIGLVTSKEITSRTHWNKGTVYGILHNRVYCGDMVQGKYNTNSYVQKKLPQESWIVTENTHEGLISRELFEAVQTLWNKQGYPNSNHYIKPSSENIFKRKVFCGHCGYTMRRIRTSEKTYQFKCETRNTYEQDDCVFVSINERELKAKLIEQLREHTLVFKKKQKIHELISMADTADSDALDRIVPELQDKISLRASSYTDFVKGVHKPDEFIELKAIYSKQIDELTTKEESIKKRIRERYLQYKALENADRYFQSIRKISDFTAESINRLIDKILIYEDKRIEVFFKFKKEYDACSPEYWFGLLAHGYGGGNNA